MINTNGGKKPCNNSAEDGTNKRLLLVCYPQAIGIYVPLSRGLQQLGSLGSSFLIFLLPPHHPSPDKRLVCCRSHYLNLAFFQVSTI